MKILFAAGITLLLTLSGASSHAKDFKNEVFVLTPGYVQPIENRGFLPGAQTDGARKVASTVSLIQGRDIVLIADPGMAAQGVWEKIIDKLRSKGVAPKDVTHVFISHHHPDHTIQLGLFPNAIVVDFWATYKDDIWEDHPDNYELAPGIHVVRTPGHTNEDASLLVETEEGNYAFTHLWWGPGLEPKEDPLAEDMEGIKKYRQLLLQRADWIVPGHGQSFRNPHRKPVDLTPRQRDILINAVQKSSAAWIEAFNRGDFTACANAYEINGVMTAKPFGTFIGREEIQAFWKKLILQGYAKVRYVEPAIEVINANTAVVSSKWEMNKAYGIITEEIWVLQEDGQAKLKIDNFEVIGNK